MFKIFISTRQVSLDDTPSIVMSSQDAQLTDGRDSVISFCVKCALGVAMTLTFEFWL